MATVVLLSMLIFCTAALIMAVGVIFRRPCLRGSCGGPSVVGSNGESLSCSTCPNRDKSRKQAAAGSDGLPVIQ